MTVVELLRELGKVFTPIRWTTPAELSRHRAVLAARLAAGDDSPYLEPLVFPVVDPRPTMTLIGALRAAARALPEHQRHLVVSSADDTAAHLAAIVSRNDAQLSSWSIGNSGLPTPEVTAEAEAILERPVAAGGEATLNAADLVASISSALGRHGLADWTVEVDPTMASKASVNGAFRRIRVRDDVTLTEFEVQRITAHEVGGHVLRWENAMRQKEPLAAFPFANGAADEEGLAALREREYGFESGENLRRYATRVLGVAQLQELNLLGLGRFLLQYLNAGDAAELALRLRRGITDPESPGGITKDHGYLSGLLHLAGLPDDDIALMRATKWGGRHLETARQLRSEGMISTDDLIEYTVGD